MRHAWKIALTAAALTTACTEPPKPEKAKNLDKIEKAEDKGSKGSKDLPDLPSGPVAKVGDVEISNKAFRSIYDLKVKKYTDKGREIPASADRRYRKSLTERLIYQEVLRQEGAKLGVEFDKAALAEREEKQKRGIKDWEKHLERRGETEESLREMYTSELREKAILEKLGKLSVSDEDVAAEYEKVKNNYTSDKPRVRASHILIPIGPRPEPGKKQEPATDETKKKWEAEAKAKADEVYKLASAADADFAALAKEHSTGPSAGKGGDLNIFTRDRMVEEFSNVAFKLKEGQVSKPVKTKFGYHVIKLTGKWPAGPLPLEALEDQIRERLSLRKLHQGRTELKNDLLAKYTVVNNMESALGPDPVRKRPKRAPSKPADAKDGAKTAADAKDGDKKPADAKDAKPAEKVVNAQPVKPQ